MFILQCSEVETKPNIDFFVPSLENHRLPSTFTLNTWCKAFRGVMVTKLSRLSQKLVILCPGWQKAIQLAIHSPNEEFRIFWLCLCMCAAPTTISQPVPSLFQRELDAL